LPDGDNRLVERENVPFFIEDGNNDGERAMRPVRHNDLIIPALREKSCSYETSRTRFKIVSGADSAKNGVGLGLAVRSAPFFALSVEQVLKRVLERNSLGRGFDRDKILG